MHAIIFNCGCSPFPLGQLPRRKVRGASDANHAQEIDTKQPKRKTNKQTTPKTHVAVSFDLGGLPLQPCLSFNHPAAPGMKEAPKKERDWQSMHRVRACAQSPTSQGSPPERRGSLSASRQCQVANAPFLSPLPPDRPPIFPSLR